MTLDLFQDLRAWLSKQGEKSGFHSDVTFEEEPSGGHAVKATHSLPTNTVVVTMPFSAAITPEVAKNALLSLVNRSPTQTEDIFASLSERQLLALYVCVHWITGLATLQGFNGSIKSHVSLDHFVHAAYINTLPPPSSLCTPVHFSQHELNAFRGTNLYGATHDRRALWEAEWEQCRVLLNQQLGTEWADRLTWVSYATAATYISSRAFPSTVLSLAPTLISSPSSHPVLLPGIDALNHKRGQAVSWVVDGSNPSNITISIQVHTPTAAGEELFNNYGAKPNSELILGYGFAIEENLEDTIVFRVGGGPTTAGKAHEVGREARGAESVYTEVLQHLRTVGNYGEGDNQWEDELDAAEMLSEMVEASLSKLPSIRDDDNEIRQAVHTMLVRYVEGQRSILESMLQWASAKRHEVIADAEAAGIHIEEELEDHEEA